MSVEFKFELGSTVRDKVDKFEGVVMMQIRNATGCLQYTIYARGFNSDGKEISRWYVDESRLLNVPEQHIIVFK